MDEMLGLLRIRVRRGRNLAIRDKARHSSDPYVVLTLGKQKFKTKVVKNNCNPEWNEELTLSIRDTNFPILLTVYDKDTLTADDKMGEVNIDIRPFVAAHKMGLNNLPNGCTIKWMQPTRENCLTEESPITWNEGKILQDMILKLQNVESGEVHIQLEWIDVPGCKGIRTSTGGGGESTSESRIRFTL
ncbi:Protein C2-DOMAIN ABA-RELATED 7 [Linum perenne]